LKAFHPFIVEIIKYHDSNKKLEIDPSKLESDSNDKPVLASVMSPRNGKTEKIIKKNAAQLEKVFHLSNSNEGIELNDIKYKITLYRYKTYITTQIKEKKLYCI
jgi:hypothetical protein